MSFPVLGNALAWFTGLPRRESQVLILLSTLGLVLYALYRHFPGRNFVTRGLKQVFRLFLFSIGFVAFICLIAFANGRSISASAIVFGIVGSVWLYVSGLNLLKGFRFGKPKTEMFTPSLVFDRFVLILLWGLVLIAYFKGPSLGQVEMAFGGSTTLTGTIAAIFGAIAFGSLARWHRWIGLLLAVYMGFLATSRTGLLLFALLLAAISVFSWQTADNWKSGLKKILIDWALVFTSVFIVVFPAQFSNYYPYFSSRPPNDAGARIVYLNGEIVTEWERFSVRYSRIGRLIPHSNPIENSADDLLGRLEAAENRWEILFRSIEVVKENPWGYWPQSFEKIAMIRCGRPPICAYPHNVVLEIGYYFGWVPLLIMLFGLLALAVRVALTLNHDSLAVRITAVALLGYLGFAQLSGNLLDNLMTVILGVTWMALTARNS